MCQQMCVDSLKMQLLCHENDARLSNDTSLRRRIAALYLPLFGIVLNVAGRLHDPYYYKIDYHSGGSSGDANSNTNDDLLSSSTFPTFSRALTKEVFKNISTLKFFQNNILLNTFFETFTK